MTALVTGLAAALAVLLAAPARPRLPVPDPVPSVVHPPVADRSRLRRLVVSLLVGAAAGLFLGGPLAPVAAVVAASVAWAWLGRVEPAAQRRSREAAAQDLPALVQLLAAGLRSGAAPAEAVRLACAALPGAAADRLTGVAERLSLGADPVGVWAGLAVDDALAPLGRSMARAQETGAPVVAAVERLAGELEAELRAVAESRARAVGVRAALPLGLCLLPSFLLLGIVPLAAGLLRGITA